MKGCIHSVCAYENRHKGIVCHLIGMNKYRYIIHIKATINKHAGVAMQLDYFVQLQNCMRDLYKIPYYC